MRKFPGGAFNVKASKYNFFFPGSNGRVLAYNARTGSFLILTSECYEKISTQTSEIRASGALKYLLMEFGFLVPDDVDELLTLRHEIFQTRFSRNSLAITIAPTLGCNLRCKYCYEQEHQNREVMSAEVESAFLEFISRTAPEHGLLSTTWYGGEPLLVPEVVLRISRSIRRIAEEHSSRFTVGLITNGTLLEQSLVSQLSDLGGGHIQITVDGPREVHDKRRPFAGGKGSYDTILRNLSSIDFGRFNVAIRCNLDRHNASTAPLMLPELARHELTKKLGVYPAPVVPWPGVTCRDATEACFDMVEFMEARKPFEAEARRLGFRTGLRPAPRRQFCGADNAYSFTLAPNGSLYRCWNHVGDERLAIGNILYSTTRVHPLMDWTYYDPTRDPQCSDCKFLPLCVGGCPEKARVFSDNGTRECESWKYELGEVLRQWAADWLQETVAPC